MEYRRATPKNVIHIRIRVEGTEFVLEEQGQPVAVVSPVEPLAQD